MKFGLAFASSIATGSKSSIEIAKKAESAGFDSVWGGEHVICPDDIGSKYPYSEDGAVPMDADTEVPDPLIWLAYVGAAAPTLKLGTCILIVPQRNPLVLAKELATLDQLTDGRVELGIGVGWMEEEFKALGIPWERRGARNDEYLAAMRALWAGPHAEFHGEFVDFPPATCNPRPVGGNIPILVGGDTPVAIRRAARLADGYFPGTSDTDELARLIAEVRKAAEQEDRDPDSIAIHCIFGAQMGDPVNGAERLTEMGVSRVMLPAFFFAGPDGMDRLEQFGEDVIKPLNA